MAAPRIVFDTNIVLSALLFANGRLAWIRHAWQAERVRPIVCKETMTELLRVLAYPKFKLSRNEQEQLLMDFLPFVENVRLTDKPKNLPTCRDPHDQIFLALARKAKANALVSGDADLLSLREDFSPAILSADEFKTRFMQA